MKKVQNNYKKTHIEGSLIDFRFQAEKVTSWGLQRWRCKKKHFKFLLVSKQTGIRWALHWKKCKVITQNSPVS